MAHAIFRIRTNRRQVLPLIFAADLLNSASGRAIARMSLTLERSMLRKVFFSILMLLSLTALIYGVFFREFKVYDNLEKFDQLKNVGIKIKIPGYDQQQPELTVQSQWFSEPEVVNASTFDGIGLYKDGRLISNYPDLRMLKGRRPCPT
jgi:hypothetical protein